MPKIIKGGVEYGSAPNNSTWEGTQAQYDAIVSPDPNVTYYITDGVVNPMPAKNVEYDNTLSGLSATTVQSAIDEVNAKTLSDGLHNITLESGFTIDEYMNYFKIGRLVVVNIGGVKHNATTANATVCQGLPIMRSRALGVVANDSTTNKVTLLYGAIGSDYFRISAHEANVRYYGQITYLTD